MSRLEAHGASVRRGDRDVLADATVVLQPGTLTAVLGPNGSGKSTLLRVLAGRLRPTSGAVLLDGRSLETYAPRDFAQRVAFLPQDTRVDFAFTVEEVVAMGRHPHRGRFERERSADRDAVEAALARCDVGALRRRTLDALSGGERQRVAIARCLATGPAVLLLDEPTAHLDLDHALALLELSGALADSGHAVAVATHDLALAARFATRAAVLRGGHVVATGSAADVLTPDVCRDVFRVGAEVATTASGRPAFVFSRIDGGLL